MFTQTTLEGRAGTDTGQHAPRRTRHTTRSPSVTVPTDKTQNRPNGAVRGHARQSGRQGAQAGHTRIEAQPVYYLEVQRTTSKYSVETPV